MTGSDNPEVLILGAGMAGLTAARALAETGIGVVVAEARDRVGGRIYSQRTPGGVWIENGAEFIHGRPPELWSLIEEAGLRPVQRSGTMLREQERGEGVKPEQDSDEEDGIFSPLEALADLPGEDLSFADWLAHSDLPEWQRKPLTNYVEGFNAADAHRISARSLGIQQRAEKATGGDRSWHLPEGYAQVAEYLATRCREAGAQIRLKCAVRDVRWRPGDVVVTTSQGDLRARKCIITLPLGVLQAANSGDPRSVRIEPEPHPLFEARRLAMGQVLRFSLVFRERWWERAPVATAHALRTMSFLFTADRMPPVWWTRHPEASRMPVLVGWAGGPTSEAMRGKRPEELAAHACRELAELFQLPAKMISDDLLGTYTFDWSADPFAGGAYSYVRAGALDAPAAMSEPEAGTLFFAGEHTDTTGHWGTVHAAIRSGLRAARQVTSNMPAR